MKEYHLLLYVHTYHAACAPAQVLCTCVHYECINDGFLLLFMSFSR